MPTRRSYGDDDIVRAVAESVSIAETLRRLGVLPEGGNYRVLHRHIRRLGLDTSHFLGQAWAKGIKKRVAARDLEAVLVGGSECNPTKLKQRLIRAGLKKAACERCRRVLWNGEPIPLELDHINGKANDNRLENLRLLCPNCHAQTPTYRGRNIGKAR